MAFNIFHELPQVKLYARQEQSFISVVARHEEAKLVHERLKRFHLDVIANISKLEATKFEITVAAGVSNQQVAQLVRAHICIAYLSLNENLRFHAMLVPLRIQELYKVFPGYGMADTLLIYIQTVCELLIRAQIAETASQAYDFYKKEFAGLHAPVEAALVDYQRAAEVLHVLLIKFAKDFEALSMLQSVRQKVERLKDDYQSLLTADVRISHLEREVEQTCSLAEKLAYKSEEEHAVSSLQVDLSEVRVRFLLIKEAVYSAKGEHAKALALQEAIKLKLLDLLTTTPSLSRE